jgi:tRNA A-37 threonylcarbamoyl transferase component Bud32/multisubunit Na+/H+ antiporter MnhG subunit
MAAIHHKTGRLTPQSFLQERYLIIGTAGQGGMGAIYEAIDTLAVPQQRVAIKEMSQSQSQDQKTLAKAVRHFRLEAAILRTLDHPNIPRVYDSFSEHDRQYLVMDFIEGQTLLQMLYAAGNNPLQLGNVLNYACQLCDVLSYLHRQYPPVMFRDLKPSNVMVTPDGHLYLIDFGIARFFNKQGDTEVALSIGYAAPEQYQGNASPSSDLYGLGVTIFCCLTATDPMQNKPTFFDFDFRLLRFCNPQAPQALDHLLMCLLDRDAEQRPASADAVRQELNHIMADMHMPPVPQQIILPGGSAGYSPNAPTLPYGPTITPPLPRRTALLPFSAAVGLWALCTAFFAAFTRSLFTASGRLQLQAKMQHFSPGDVKSGIVAGYENLDIWIRELLSNVLTPRFLLLLLVRLILLTSVSVYLFQLFHASYPMAAFCIALLLFIMMLYAGINKKIRDPLARSMLLSIAFFALLACFSLQALPAVQTQLHTLSLAQVLSLLLLLLACVMLVRTKETLIWTDHLGAIGIVSSCAFLLYGYGLQIFTQFSASVTAPTPGTTIATYAQAIEVSVAFLTFFALIFLLRLSRAFSGIERFFLLLAALLLALLQWKLGYEEFRNMPVFASGLRLLMGGPESLSAFRFYVLVALIPVVFAIVALFVGKRYPYLNRLSLTVLLLSCVSMIVSLGQPAILAFPLSSPNPLRVQPLAVAMQHLLTPNQLFISVLIVVAIVLLVRFTQKFSDRERIALSMAAIAGASLLSTFWSGAIQHSQLPRMLTSVSLPEQLSTIALNQLVAGSLLYAGIMALVLFVITLLIQSARQLSWVEQRMKALSKYGSWGSGLINLVDRLIIFGIALVATLLLLFFGATIPFLQQSLPVQGMSMVITFGEIVTLLIALLALIALIRITRPVRTWDRFTLLVGIGVFIVLAFTTPGVLLVASPIIGGVQQGTAKFLRLVAPGILLFFSVSSAALIALIWLKRTPTRDRLLRLVLFVSFAGAIACMLLQYVRPTLLLVAFILLVQGMFIAIQMERVR